MYNLAESEDYNTEYLAWPKTISRRCDVCNRPVKFAHPDNGKIVQILNEDIHQVEYLYTCENPKCENYHHYFNPAQRYDFNAQHIGKEVLSRIAREMFIFEQNPEQIHKRLTLDYNMHLSLRNVQRIFTDILLVKANKIDEKTRKLIQQNGGIVIAMDGQDPGAGMMAIWLFTDVITGRILKTVLTKSMPGLEVHKIIETILADYNTKLLGSVSDKQNNLEYCMQTYYHELPIQFCTFHFANHLWDHLVVFDNQLYMALKETINHLYIHTHSSEQEVTFEGIGKAQVKNIFKDIDSDFQKMLHYRNKRFKFLRGLALYRTLKRYISEMEDTAKPSDGTYRIDKITSKIIISCKESLLQWQAHFGETLFMYDTFKMIYGLLYAEIWERADRQQRLDDIFGKCWAIVHEKAPQIQMDKLKSFNPKAESTCVEILCEWVRAWNSYLPNLFSYYDFPVTKRTNVDQERAFSEEKTALTRRMANKEVGLMQELQGELYLRFSYCDEEELLHNIVDEYMTTELDVLRENYHEKVAKIVDTWFYKAEPLTGIQMTFKKYHPLWKNPNASTSTK